MNKTYISKLQGERINKTMHQCKMEKDVFIEMKVKNLLPIGSVSLETLETKDIINYLYFPELCTSEVPTHCKEGEWVRFRGMVLQVTWTDDDTGGIGLLSYEGINYNTGFNKVKPICSEEKLEAKERFLFAEHGRDYWEIKEGDLLISRDNVHSCDVKFVQGGFDKIGCLMANGVQDEYIEDLEELKEKYVVLVFAEDIVDDKFREVRNTSSKKSKE